MDSIVGGAHFKNQVLTLYVKLNLGGQRSQNEMGAYLFSNAIFNIWWRYLTNFRVS